MAALGEIIVQYDGEYVLTREGSRDFGEVPRIISDGKEIPAGVIRLRTGKHKDEPGNYGEKHIERAGRFQELMDNGYHNARDLVEDVARNYNAIYPGKFAPLMLVKQGTERDTLICVELTHGDNGKYYDVRTGFISRKGYTKNKTPLWVSPNSDVNTESVAAHYPQRKTSPRAITGNPDTISML
ncbi:hypothetical protein AGMMS50255_2100 [Spirochaetia bacterium]|nr:hypothetical protein AGMMS50255_2100 [Spirochaetia bacterium]